MESKAVTGKCLCGEVSFQATPPFLASAHCHCTYCQKAHGSAFVTWVVIEKKHFVLLSKEDTVQWFHSSEQSKRGFANAVAVLYFLNRRLARVSSILPAQILIRSSPWRPNSIALQNKK